MKQVRTPTYNYNFNNENGYFIRWGESLEDDPQYSPIGLEILDMEISTVCNQGCKFCYKSNIGVGTNMSFETFKNIVDKISTLTQIAFGIGDLSGNPDLLKIFEYCKNNNIAPNVTINGSGLTDYFAKSLVDLCGAVAISHYSDDICYDAVDKLTSMGLEQVNIHQLLSEETYQDILNLLESYKTDGRLSKLNAIVFLSLKQKGRGEDFTRISNEHFQEIVDYCLENNVPFGFDSCTACKFLKSIKDNDQYLEIEKMVEPCESGLFSGYCNVDGIFFPCSFSEEIQYGIDLKENIDFLQDVWYSNNVKEWRGELLDNERNCPIYEI